MTTAPNLILMSTTEINSSGTGTTQVIGAT